MLSRQSWQNDSEGGEGNAMPCFSVSLWNSIQISQNEAFEREDQTSSFTAHRM